MFNCIIQLITSFDGFCMYRASEYNDSWRTRVGWYHVDQNGKHLPDKVCVQGLVNFYDADEGSGSLVVVPDSCNIFKDVFDNHPYLGNQRSRGYVGLGTGGPV